MAKRRAGCRKELYALIGAGMGLLAKLTPRGDKGTRLCSVLSSWSLGGQLWKVVFFIKDQHTFSLIGSLFSSLMERSDSNLDFPRHDCYGFF